MKKIAIIVVLCLSFTAVGVAQDSPKKQVEAYFKGLLNNRLDLALRAFGKEPKFSESQKAVLKEYKVQDPTPVGRCEDHLRTLGKALADHNELYGGYPLSLKKLIPNSLTGLPKCPTAPKKNYQYNRRDEYYYTLSCPTGHGRTPGLPMYTPIDGVIPNPNLRLLNYYKVLDEKEENGLTKITVVGSTPKGGFEREFVFTPRGRLVSGAFSKEVERLLKAMTKSSVPRLTKLDPASLLFGVAVVSDQDLVKAAHCRLKVEKLYYRILGVQTRLGEKSFAQVAKHIDEFPTCPSSKKKLMVKKLPTGKTRIFCPGHAHKAAELKINEPGRNF